ncbi:MAG: hypothetical protein IPL60_18575 [Ardenticatenia bacterium]|nr:hypothetical protein [Ardenticatenia bacterium]
MPVKNKHETEITNMMLANGGRHFQPNALAVRHPSAPSLSGLNMVPTRPYTTVKNNSCRARTSAPEGCVHSSGSSAAEDPRYRLPKHSAVDVELPAYGACLRLPALPALHAAPTQVTVQESEGAGHGHIEQQEQAATGQQRNGIGRRNIAGLAQIGCRHAPGPCEQGRRDDRHRRKAPGPESTHWRMTHPMIEPGQDTRDHC